MYGNYISSTNNERDDPECATYPKSGGRPTSLFNKRWGNRFNCKPVPMTWDDEDELEDESPAATGIDDLSDVLTNKQNNIDENEAAKDQSWQNDSHQDPGADLTYEQLLSSANASSNFEHRHIHMEHTYPNSYSMNSNPLLKEEETPLKPIKYQIAKTELKKKKDNWLDGFLSKTPFPEESQAANNSHLFGDSGIGLTTTKVAGDDKESIVKTSSRSLFTPAPKHNAEENSGRDLLLQNRVNGVNDDIKKIFSTPLCNRTSALNQLNEKSPVKMELDEKLGIQDIVRIQKLERKPGSNQSQKLHLCCDENKENLNLPHVKPANLSEERDKKLLRSQSHASVLKAENDQMFTPCKEESSTSAVTAAKSLSNLFQSGIPQSAHASRIPTPIRSHTPHKQLPQTFWKPEGNTLLKSSHSPEKKELPISHMKSSVSFENKQSESAHQFGNAPVIHSLLPNAGFTSHSGKSIGQNSSLPHVGSGVPISHPPKPHSEEGLFQNLASQFGVPHTFGEQECRSGVDSHHASNSSHQHSKSSQSHNLFLNPNGVETIDPRIKTDHFHSNNNDSAQPHSAIHQQQSQGQSLPRKTFTMKQPVFQALTNKELYHDVIPSSASHSLSGQSTCPSSIQISHPSFSASSTHGNTHPFKAASYHLSTSTASSVYSGAFVHHVEKNQFNQHASHLPSVNHIGHQPAHGIFSNARSEHGSGSLSMGIQMAQPMNVMHSVSDSASTPHLNIQASRAPSAVKDFAVPAPATSGPAASCSVNVVRQNSSQIQRKILIVNKKSYEVLRLLGKGASSKVYDVIDLQTNRCVAVKRVVLRQGDALVEGYLKEVELLNQLQGSEYIIKLIDSEVCLEKGFKVLYMVMERGEMDLSTSLRILSASKSQQMQPPSTSRSKIPVITIIYYWTSMLNAVGEIHRKGIVHSDLKPANFLLVGGQLKLIDFGIATAVQTDVTSVVKEDPAGTPNYMSPEAIGLTVVGSPNSEDTFKNPKASYKSDVWSLGCILYSLIYGRSPFQHIMNERMKLDAIRNPNYAIPYPADQPVHPPLLRALKRCLVRDYKQRASIAELKSIDYLCSNDEIDEESWDAWKAQASQKILSGISPEQRLQVIKLIQDAFKTPPARKRPS
ncbi:hypothetical protein J437_LFUL008278 [Ladona fulva]|uniref:Protein kinase domain-containing protein n=1 Tax=Ladona fulva TaxID=123851 RepID=A0A8K0K6H0_LADFU|nr:hypothetical protein J437_LFUL008278 [Ladona fulva]